MDQSLPFLAMIPRTPWLQSLETKIASKVVKSIHNCKAWALIIDTTPDISHHEQLSTCVRIVNNIGSCTEHLLSCCRASGTTVTELYHFCIRNAEIQRCHFQQVGRTNI